VPPKCEQQVLMCYNIEASYCDVPFWCKFLVYYDEGWLWCNWLWDAEELCSSWRLHVYCWRKGKHADDRAI